MSKVTISVDLGSGPVPKNPFDATLVEGLDITPFPHSGNVFVCDLAKDRFPHEDSSVDFVVGTDFLEHIPRTGYRYRQDYDGGNHPAGQPYLEMYNPFLHVMSETWRILKPGGITQFKTPAFPKQEAFQDPTHVNFISENTSDYFAGGLLPLCQQYGFKGAFEFAWPQRWENFWLVWEFRALK